MPSMVEEVSSESLGSRGAVREGGGGYIGDWGVRNKKKRGDHGRAAG